MYIFRTQHKKEVAHSTRRVAISGSEQQEGPVLDVDPPTNEPIDVDEDESHT